jgi:hypothetical protein
VKSIESAFAPVINEKWAERGALHKTSKLLQVRPGSELELFGTCCLQKINTPMSCLSNGNTVAFKGGYLVKKTFPLDSSLPKTVDYTHSPQPLSQKSPQPVLAPTLQCLAGKIIGTDLPTCQYFMNLCG